MVVLNKIYTKTGDDGTTALGSGERRMKFDLRVDAYGSVDEANAAIGLARVHSGNMKLDGVLERVQNDLFDLGADLAVPSVPHDKDGNPEFEPLRILNSQTVALEDFIDDYNAELEPLRTFVLSGGNALAAQLHMARTITRRAERICVELSKTEGEDVNSFAIQYLNRLSDLLFVLARFANEMGKADILWVPGKNR